MPCVAPCAIHGPGLAVVASRGRWSGPAGDYSLCGVRHRLPAVRRPPCAANLGTESGPIRADVLQAGMNRYRKSGYPPLFCRLPHRK